MFMDGIPVNIFLINNLGEIIRAKIKGLMSGL